MNSATEIGRSFPLGATIADGGVNFSLFSRTATGVELLFFDNESDARPSRVVPIDPAANRTYHYWHVFVPGAEPGQIYGYRVQGPHDPSRGMRFDPAKILLDPYGRGVVVPGNYRRDSACKQGENTATAMKSVVVDSHAYDWEGDTPLRQPWARTIIYEMHVRGFTRHPSSNIAEERRGTLAGHDGFTLNDLVSYNDKHNEANGEENRDGGNDNRSWNCGAEGPTDDPVVEKLRNRQAKNFMTVVSLGVPMLLMGDEARHSQHGNNNAYCQDNDTSWFDWTLVAKHAELRRFVKVLIARRLLRDVEHERQRVSLNQLIREARKAWHGVKLNLPDWNDNSHSIALTAEIRRQGLVFHLIMNAYWESLDFELPTLGDSSDNQWRRWIDTGLDAPHDIVEWEASPRISSGTYRAGPRSVVVLFAEAAPVSSGD